MMRAVIVTALMTASFGATAAVYKCKDAAGNTTYSESPCPSSASQQRLQTDADVLSAFLTQLHAIASYRTAWDINFLEQSLGVRLKENPDGTGYLFAQVPPQFPAVGGGVRASYGGLTSIDLQIDPARCVSPEMIGRVFGPAAETGQLNYQVKGSSAYGTGYSTNVSASLDFRRARKCVRSISLRQNYSRNR